MYNFSFFFVGRGPVFTVKNVLRKTNFIDVLKRVPKTLMKEGIGGYDFLIEGKWIPPRERVYSTYKNIRVLCGRVGIMPESYMQNTLTRDKIWQKKQKLLKQKKITK